MPCAWPRVLQRRALLVSPANAMSTLRRDAEWSRIQSLHRAGAQTGQLGPRGAGVGLVLAGGATPVALPEPGRRAAGHDAEHCHRNDDHEERQGEPERGIVRIKRIKRNRHRVTVGNREGDENQAQRNQYHRIEKFSHDPLSPRKENGSALVWWFRSSLHRCDESIQRTSQPNPP